MRVSVEMAREDWADADVPLPDYQTAGAAGADLRANLPVVDRADGLLLRPGARMVVPTGLRVMIPEGFEMQIRARSGLALRHGVGLPNAPGTIDSDYRGPLGVLLVNHGHTAFRVRHGARVAQVVIAAVGQAAFVLVDALPDSARGTGGFGSTGVR